MASLQLAVSHLPGLFFVRNWITLHLVIKGSISVVSDLKLRSEKVIVNSSQFWIFLSYF